MKPLERHLQKSVLRRLEQLRQADHTLAFRKRHGTAMGTAGDPDVYGVWGGVPFELELKQIGEEPTPLQTARLREWALAGARVGVIHSMSELNEWVKTIQKGA